MFLRTLIIYFCILMNYFCCNCFEPLSTTAIVVGGTALTVSISQVANYMYCKYNECCDKHWINFNASAFDTALQENLYGQHLVRFVVPRSLKGHFGRKIPKKPLVMSFHGWTGSGKNYVSKMIEENLYKAGSQFVHWYVGTKHFPHEENIKIYRDKLQKEIQVYTKQCGNSIFIFDELDKMPAGILDVLKPYLDYHEHIDGIDYRRNIFIFLSNSGGSDITRIAFNFWINGKERELITMKDIEPLINHGVFNERGGLYRSEIVAANLIDVYVPFLPLERKHVEKCIEAEIKNRGGIVKESIVKEVASQLTFYPPEFERFSQAGCKMISQKLDIYGDEYS